MLATIRRDHRRLSAVMSTISAYDGAGAFSRGRRLQHRGAEPLANALVLLSDQLSGATRADAIALIDQNRTAYASPRDLVIAVGAASALLALLLGYVLARSVVAPIELTEERLEGIAAGDFSAHLDVPNRDELGALATNVNRMNDELGGYTSNSSRRQPSSPVGTGRSRREWTNRVKELRASRTRVVPPRTPSGDESNVTFTMALSSISSDSPSSCGSRASSLTPTREAKDLLGAGRTKSRRRWSSFATSRTASTRRSFWTAGSQTHCGGNAPAPIRPASTRTRCDATRRPSRRRSTSAASRRCRTPRSTPATPPQLRFESAAGGETLSFDVSDDGFGFDIDGGRAGVGMTNMGDRVGAVGGSLHVASAPGAGTTVSGSIPLEG